MTVFDKNKT